MTRIASHTISASKSAKLLLLSASVLAIASVPAEAADVLFASNGTTTVEEGRPFTNGAQVLQIRLENGATLSFTQGAEFTLNSDGSVNLAKGGVTVAGAGNSQTTIHMPEGVNGTVGGTGNAATFEVSETGSTSGHTLTGTSTIMRGREDRSFSEGQMWASSGRNGIRRVMARGPQNTPQAREPQVADVDTGGPLAAAQNGQPVSLGDALASAGASADIIGAARRVEAANGNPQLETYPVGDLALLVALAADLQNAYGGAPFQAAQADIIRTYLGFLANGGSGANFLTAYSGFLTQYLDLVRVGGLPSSFDAAALTDINAFLAYQGNLGALANLSAQDQALAQAYLAFLQGGGNGDLFAAQFTDLIEAYFAFVRGGGNPLEFTGASQEVVDAYIAFLSQSGLSGQLSADNQTLIQAYLTSGGFNFAAQYAAALEAYFAFLQQGNLPSQYADLDAGVVQAYLEALQASGLFDQLLGQQAQFYANYLAFLQGGGNPDLFAGLPNADLVPFADALNDYAAFLAGGGLPSNYDAATLELLASYLSAIDNAGQLTNLLGGNSSLLDAYFTYLAGGANADLFGGLPIYASYGAALQAYYTYLAGGGLPANYSALTQQQITNYLAALSAAGGFATQLGDLSDFFTAYYAFVSTGGTPAQFSGLPLYANYVSALNAYYAFLAGGGLPGDYTALTQQQISNYLAALASAGGFGAFANLNGFFTSYYAFVQGGGDPADFSGLPVYADYLTAISQYYAYLAGGGVPSAYTALTQQQIQAYLQALADSGLLTINFSGDILSFYTNYLAYLAGGGVADNFGGLPGAGSGGGSGSTATQLAGANVWLYDVGRAFRGTASTADVTVDGQITRTVTGSTVNDFTGGNRTLREFGRVGNIVAWTRYERGLVGGNANFNEHLLVGAPATNLPASGKVNYRLVGGTAPTDALATAGSSGSFSGSLAVAFGATPTVGISFDVYSGTLGWHAQTAGGAADPTNGGAQVGSDGRFTTSLQTTGLIGGACALSGCTSGAHGGLFGDGASNVGIEYFIADSTTGGIQNVNGVAIFGTTGTELAQIGTTPTPPVTTTVVQNQSFAYANPLIGDDVYSLIPVTYDANGFPVGYLASADEGLTSGTTTLLDSGKAGGVISWARWANGTPGGKYYNSAIEPVGPNGGYHVIAGSALTNMPASGAVAYDLIGFTTPTRHNESTSTGSVTGGAAVVFGVNPVAALDLTVVSGSDSFNLFTSGKLTDPTQSTLAIRANGSFETLGVGASQGAVSIASASAFCTSGCNTFVEGFLAGDGASHMGLAYSIRSNTVPNQFIDGSAAFAAGAAINLGGGGGATGTADGVVPTSATGKYIAYQGAGGDNNGPVSSVTVTSGKFVSAAGIGNGAAISITTNGNSVTETDGDQGVIGWQRSENVGVDYRSSSGQGLSASAFAGQSWHTVWGTPLVNLPTSGLINYELIGSTKATQTNAQGGLGSFTGALAVDFGTLKVGLDASVAFGGNTYAFASAGGVTAPSMSLTDDGFGGRRFGSNLTTTANGTTSVTRGTYVQGFLAGDGASHAGLTYSIKTSSSNAIQGAATFRATGSGTGGGTGGGNTTSNFTGTRDGIVYYTYTNGSLANGFGGSATFANGAVTGLSSIFGTISSNGAQIVEAGDVGDLAWARWTGGTVVATGVLGGSTVIGANGGYHVFAGKTSTSLPASGTVNYSLIATTSATDNKGSTPGTISGDLAIAFGSTAKVGYNMQIAVGGRSWGVETAGGVANPSASQVNLVTGTGIATFSGQFLNTVGQVTATGGACAGSCSVSVGGSLYGANGAFAGVAVNVTDSSVTNGVITASGLAIFSADAPASGGLAPSTTGTTQASLASVTDWDRWEVNSGSINAGSDMAMLAPGMEALAMRGIQFSAEQLAQLEAYQAAAMR
ncbi:hypothetical protein GCM10009127_09350 [Alteraurantiacibacter aestuarii]|uniref:DUF4214 domain-containing protein n=1 Tax=Alteraurantiacibacter aestuarii TaxID=650004 RepID=A0A844ZIR2_9SPHN|nr:hypothetical protein [Alteraurantiacibacter aestuarii]MXO87323.1 hypothetical protein [Alteraurantiacibacter aestuarii]